MLQWDTLSLEMCILVHVFTHTCMIMHFITHTFMQEHAHTHVLILTYYQLFVNVHMCPSNKRRFWHTCAYVHNETSGQKEKQSRVQICRAAVLCCLKYLSTRPHTSLPPTLDSAKYLKSVAIAIHLFRGGTGQLMADEADGNEVC